MKRILPLLIGCLSMNFLLAQTWKPLPDSAQTLDEVVIKAYENNRRLIEIPAAVAVVTKAQLNRFNNTNIVSALNTQPGVRMDERTPGSYRLNIRGSSLRSPFGVRNVKIYYNDIPYTDPGGHTYLNQLGFYNFQSLEVIKGPGSSLYGAGTGGVVLIKSDPVSFTPGISLDYGMGSYGLQNFNANLRIGNDDFQNSINYQQLKSDGYRDHTELERKVFTWDATVKAGDKGTLKAHLLYGDVFYETPGALTLAEYTANPKGSRPAGGPLPGNAQAKAAVIQKMFFSGFSYNQQFNEHWQNTTSLYGAFTSLKNPTTRNYARSSEPNVGGRNVLQYKTNINRSELTVHGGIELQQGFTSLRLYKTNLGNPDSLQTDDEINNRNFFVFTQVSLELPAGWIITGGISLNRSNVEFTRLSTVPSTVQKRTYDNEFAPRLAILKKITPVISIYGSVSRGFSPPTSAELLPSTGIISTALDAESGINYELGLRGSLLDNKLFFDINAFYFQLKNTIVQRRDSTGGDYFENAGSTKQKGIETLVSYQLADKESYFINNAKVWVSHTWHDFHYKDFKQITNDYSGKRIPSVPEHYVSAGLDVNTKAGLYTNITWFYSDPVPLNDANTDFATSFNVLGARLGFRKSLHRKLQIDLFGTVDNIFDTRYSLGNDINGFGGRYYNAASGINYFGGISVKVSCR